MQRVRPTLTASLGFHPNITSAVVLFATVLKDVRFGALRKKRQVQLVPVSAAQAGQGSIKSWI